MRAFGVIGGGAALAFLGATAGQTLIQAGVLGGLGVAGMQTIISSFYMLTMMSIISSGAAGVGVMMMGECSGPLMCTAQSGQCCTVIFTSTSITCPASC